MIKNDLILRNPLRIFGHGPEEIIAEGCFGAVLARAGVGKTALMVQLALYSLLRNKNVLHIGLDDPVHKVSLWYEEVFRHISKSYDLYHMNRLWETVLTHRFIMTFQVEGFSVPKFEERLTDLTEQSIFLPQMIIIDGLPFDAPVHETLQELKILAKNHALSIWFSVRTHRDDKPDPAGLPAQFEMVEDLFDVALKLKPEGKKIYIKTLKGGFKDTENPELLLDPSTMLIKK